MRNLTVSLTRSFVKDLIDQRACPANQSVSQVPLSIHPSTNTTTNPPLPGPTKKVSENKKKAQLTDPLNLHPHIIPMPQHHLWIPQHADARRRPGHDQGAPLQRRPLRQVRDRLLDAEDHFLGAGILDQVPVVDGFDGEGVRVWEGGAGDEEGADGGGGVEACFVFYSLGSGCTEVERRGGGGWWVDMERGVEGDLTFCKGPLRSLHLLRPCADVVAARVPQYMLHGLLPGDVAARLANHDRQLGLVVARAVLRQLRHADLLRVRARECGARFDEKDGRGGDWHVGFDGVVAVVEAQAADQGHFVQGEWSQELGDGHGAVGDGAVEDGPRDEFRFNLFLFEG